MKLHGNVEVDEFMKYLIREKFGKGYGRVRSTIVEMRDSEHFKQVGKNLTKENIVAKRTGNGVIKTEHVYMGLRFKMKTELENYIGVTMVYIPGSWTDPENMKWTARVARWLKSL